MAKVKLHFDEYTKEDLMKMDPVLLGALLRERTHHTIEVLLYSLLNKDMEEPRKNLGKIAEFVFDVWKERGLPMDRPDIKWCQRYIEIAKKVRSGEKVEIAELGEAMPRKFNAAEMEIVNRLIYERRSLRDWEDREVPDDMIEKILEAGRFAPIGCNLGHVRFVVLKTEEEKKFIWSDISIHNAAVIIVICYDSRIRKVVGQDKMVPQNAGYDMAAAADHMLLMAHALGLGGVWLSSLKETEKTKNTGEIFKEKYGLPEYIEVGCHIAVGWPAFGTIKSERPPLEELIIRKSE